MVFMLTPRTLERESTMRSKKQSEARLFSSWLMRALVLTVGAALSVASGPRTALGVDPVPPLTFTHLAGSVAGFGRSDGTGSAARFTHPYGVAADGSGNVYVADFYNHTIRKVSSTDVANGDSNCSPNGSFGRGLATRSEEDEMKVQDASANLCGTRANDAILGLSPNGTPRLTVVSDSAVSVPEIAEIARNIGGACQLNVAENDEKWCQRIGERWGPQLLGRRLENLKELFEVFSDGRIFGHGEGQAPGGASETAGQMQPTLPDHAKLKEVPLSRPLWQSDGNSCRRLQCAPEGSVCEIRQPHSARCQSGAGHVLLSKTLTFPATEWSTQGVSC
jgi:NHL repeat